MIFKKIKKPMLTGGICREQDICDTGRLWENTVSERLSSKDL